MNCITHAIASKKKKKLKLIAIFNGCYFFKKYIKGIDIYIYIIYNTYINKKQEVNK